MGVSTLYHLAKLGWTDSILLEKNDLTHGSTWHAAGLCTHYAHDLTIMQMRAYSASLYRDELPAAVERETGFRTTGGLRLATRSQRMDEYRHVQGIGKIAGQPFEIVSAQRIKELHPLVHTEGVIGGIYEPNDGNVDPTQATLALAAGARNLGAKIFINNQVVDIQSTCAGEWCVSTANMKVVCEHLINAAGMWCRQVGEFTGIDIPVVPVEHQYFVTTSIERVRTNQSPLPIVRDPDESWYIRHERDGLIFGPYEKDAALWSVDGIDPEFGAELLPNDYERIDEVMSAAIDRVPDLGNVGIKQGVNGLIPFTPDANPLLGPVHDMRNMWLATGSSMGIMEGGGAGRFVAEWIVHGEAPMDPISVDPRRFGGYAGRDYRTRKAIQAYAHQFAAHYPYEERPAARPARITSFHTQLAEKGAVFGEAFGWERPNWYQTDDSGCETADSFRRTNWFASVERECRAVAAGVSVSDLSVLSKFEVSGPDAEKFMAHLGANLPPQAVGQISLIHVLNHAGGVLAEFVVMKTSADCYFLSSAAFAEHRDLDLLKSRAADLRVTIEPVTEKYSTLAVMGPKSQQLLETISGEDLSLDRYRWLSGRDIRIADVTVRSMRVSYIGESGWELHIPSAQGGFIYSLIRDAGAPYGLDHYGAFAMNSMRLEKGYRGFGADLTTERTPLEAGLDHLVRVNNRNFIGRDAMMRKAKSRQTWQMKLFEIESGQGCIDPFYLHPVMQGGVTVGTVTSGAFGHRTGKSLALAYLTDKASVSDNDFGVEILGVRHQAKILTVPPYDPANRKLKQV